MGKKVLDTHYDEIVKLTNVLKTLVDSYRLLIGGAAELNGIYHRKTKDVDEALDRIDNVGDIIDDLVKVIEQYSEGYIDFIKCKKEYIDAHYTKNDLKKDVSATILTEINEDLNFKNS